MNEQNLLHLAGEVVGCELTVRASAAGYLLVPANWSRHRVDRFWAYARQHLGLAPTVMDAILALTHLHGRWAGRHSASRSPRGAAATWLVDLLREQGPLPFPEVQRYAITAGHPWSTVRKSAQRVGVVKAKSTFNGPWIWTLPSEETHSHRSTGAAPGWISKCEMRVG